MARNTNARPTVCLLAMSLSFINVGLPRAAQAGQAATGVQGDIAFSEGDYTTAFRAWSDAAAAGDASAMGAVGTLYDTGHGVPQDFAEALSWYRRAASAGSVRAMFNVGVMYDNGRGTPVNRREAIRWYERAAVHGNGRAAYDLGLIYRDGDQVPRNPARAIHFFKLAAAAGIRAAAPNLAALHATVPPVIDSTTTTRRSEPPEGDPDSAAFARFQQAALARVSVSEIVTRTEREFLPTLVKQAEHGNELAQYDIGFAYEHGIGVTADPVKAYVFYVRATASAEADVTAAALKGAAEVGARLSAAQHAAARDIIMERIP